VIYDGKTMKATEVVRGYPQGISNLFAFTERLYLCSTVDRRFFTQAHDARYDFSIPTKCSGSLGAATNLTSFACQSS
jgi:hypothetical protein